ncbi:MAG: OmpA family protein [Fimbriimonadaceae bacterium]|nr:OmpA family protein [Fimbriimonadaceae bacterium]
MQDGTPIIIKKKKVSGHGHHGGAWKVAFADFVTAMMAFFMVMWIMGLSQEDRMIIQSYFEDPVGFERRQALSPISISLLGKGSASKKNGQESTSSAQEQERTEAIQLKNDVQKAVEGDANLRGLVNNDSVEISVNSEGVLLEFIENEANGEVFFELGSANVRPAARELIRRIGPLLAATRRPLQIEGHTDSRAYPGVGYDNFDLSTDRAHTVRRLLAAAGVRNQQFIQVIGYADTRPRPGTDPKHFSNRRVSVLLPYAMGGPTTPGLPADALRESIEGVFRLPTAPPSPGVEPNVDPENLTQPSEDAANSPSTKPTHPETTDH